MKLQTVQIKNYRSIFSSGKINCKNLMVFIGKNNAGKSNFLKAMELFFNGTKPKPDDFPFGITEDLMEISLTFKGLTEEFKEKMAIEGEEFKINLSSQGK